MIGRPSLYVRHCERSEAISPLGTDRFVVPPRDDVFTISSLRSGNPLKQSFVGTDCFVVPPRNDGFGRAFLFFLLISLTLLSNLYPQQQFQKLYARYTTKGGSGVSNAKQLSDGNYIMAAGIDTGLYNHDYGENALAIKTDANGDTLWTRIMSGVRSEGFNSALEMKDGNYLFVGSTQSFGKQATANVYGYYLYAVKTSPNGDTVWTKIYGGKNTDYGHNNYFSGIIHTLDGGFLLLNQVTKAPSPPYAESPMIIKCDINGDTLWTKAYADTSLFYGYSIIETTDSMYLMCGEIYSGIQYPPMFNFGQYKSNAYLSKLDKKGNPLWTKYYNGPKGGAFGSIEQLSNGDFLVAGNSGGFGADTIQNYTYILRLNSMGDTVWTKMYGPILSVSMQLINDTTFALFGFASNSSGGNVPFFKGDTRNGNVLYSQFYEGTSSVGGVSITNDGGFIISSNTDNYGSSYGEGYVIKADASGNGGCNQLPFPIQVYNTQTQVSTGTLQAMHFPIYVNSTQTQITSGIQVGTLCTNGIEQFAGNKNELTVWPNPVNDVLNVECNEEIKSVRIMDVLGKEVLRTKEKEIDVSGLENGVYFIEARMAKGSYTQKVIVQH